MESDLSSRRPNQPEIFDLVAIGAGPANLSLAALADPVTDLSVAVLERKPSFTWHPGSLFFRASVTTTPLKDLVSLVDPTSPLSFLNFLALHGRLYRHLIAGREAVSRREFAEYFSWAASRCEAVHFDVDVRAIDHTGEHFIVHTSSGDWLARNLALGIGLSPAVPNFTRALLGPQVFHSGNYLDHPREIAARDVLLIGGGQSAAEVALHVLDSEAGLPRRFTWASSRHGFLPLDDSPFSNEWFNPRYTEYFHRLPAQRREELLRRQMLSSDGASQMVLQAIYGRLYELDYLETAEIDHDILSGHELVELKKETESDAYKAVLECHDTGERTFVRADTVILATGYRSQLPQLLEPLERMIVDSETGEYQVGSDYCLEWDGPTDQGIFVQGGARRTHGVADPNLSLASWRSAVILNAVCGREIYPIERADITLSLERSPGAIADGSQA